MRILIVDDVGYVRHYFDRLLTQNGHIVWTAASGFQAIDILNQENGIQVVITDLLMPGMDGLDFFRAAQKLDRRDETGGTLPCPVFYLITALRPSTVTSHRETNMLQQALQLGFAEVLLKPIDNEHLLRHLANLERELLRNQPGVDALPVTNYTELLHTIDQNIERLLCCEDRGMFSELTELLQGSLTRIPQIISQLDARPAEPLNSLEQSIPAANSQVEPLLSTVAAESGSQ